MAVANSVVSLFYYLRVIGPMVLDNGPGHVPVLGGWTHTAIWLDLASIVGFGVAAEPLLAAFATAALLP